VAEENIAEEIAQLRRENQELKAENERLRRLLEEALRASKRQAAPFSRPKLKAQPQKPGRKSGPKYGRRCRRPVPVFRKLAEQKESRIEEGHLLPDHVHMMIAIPPKYAVSQVIGFIKGKSAIHLARVYGERKRNFVGQHFWARGYWVSTVGRDEEVIREYIRNQEQEDQRLDQINLWR